MGLLDKARNTAYEEYEETTSQPADKINEPNYADIPTIYLSCLGGCGHTYSSKSTGMGNLADAALQGHAVYCDVEPHKRNKNWYWGCQYSSCPASDDHEVACVGGCGQVAAPEWGWSISTNGYLTDVRSSPNPSKTFVSISSHKKKCLENAKTLDITYTCGFYYYQCNSSNTCPNSGSHVSSSSSGITSPPSSSTPPPSLSYHACGDHETSVSGDHSLQASCSSTDSNGNSCTVTSFYACDNHSHVYPVPTVVCPAHSWTSCGGTVSHATTCGSGHTYYTCNPEAVSAHIGHIAVVCPAHSWTSCGGMVSHATTCGSGHTYYTCNPSAVSWHTADRTCSRTGCNATYTDCSRGSDTKHCLGKYKWHK